MRICSGITLCRNTLLSPWHQMPRVAQSTAWSRFFLQFGDRRALGEVTEERKPGAAYASHCRSLHSSRCLRGHLMSFSLHNAVRCDLTDITVWKLTLLPRITQSGREKKKRILVWNATAKSSEWTDKLLIQWFRSCRDYCSHPTQGQLRSHRLVHQGLKID